jgi:hypothetical protein
MAFLVPFVWNTSYHKTLPEQLLGSLFGSFMSLHQIQKPFAKGSFMRITNVHGISLPLALWLLNDEYDYNPDPNYISATTLLKSTKQIILKRRVDSADLEMDLSDLIPSRLGSAFHDSMEKAWNNKPKISLKKLGYPDDVIDLIRINPTPEELAATPNAIPIYLEQRASRTIEVNGRKITIGGKYDQVVDGHIFDGKSTSVWGYLAGDKDEDYQKQGSVYRWLNPDIVTDDTMTIMFLFTDWQRMMTKTRADYPKIRTVDKEIPLLSLQDTEAFIRDKVAEVYRLIDEPEAKLPPCTDKELWRSAPTFKYYADPAKTDGRSTKNFDDAASANAYWKMEKGGKGVVITTPGEAKACAYCAAYEICNQRKSLDV